MVRVYTRGKTPEEIIGLAEEPNGCTVYGRSEMIRAIKIALRDALECASENAIVVYRYLPVKDDQLAEVDKQSILNLMPKEK